MKIGSHPISGTGPSSPDGDLALVGELPPPDERVAAGATSGVSPTVIAMAACQRAWAKRYAPWTLREDA